MKWLFLALLFIFSTAQANNQAIDALISLIEGDSDNDGLILTSHDPDTTATLLTTMNGYLVKQGKRPYDMPTTGRMVIIAGRPAIKLVEALERFSGVRSGLDDFEKKFIVLMNTLSTFFLELIKKEWAIGKSFLSKSLGFLTGNITYGLTMQLLKEMILRRIGIWGLLLFPVSGAVDLVAVALGFAASLITVAVTGAVIFVQAIPFALQKIIEVTGLGLIKLGKWIISKFKKRQSDFQSKMLEISKRLNASIGDRFTLEQLAGKNAGYLDAMNETPENEPIGDERLTLQVLASL